MSDTCGAHGSERACLQDLHLPSPAESESAGATYVLCFIDGMVQHHGDPPLMPFDTPARSTNPTIPRFARQGIVAQRTEILQLRLLASQDLRKPEQRRHDALFTLRIFR